MAETRTKATEASVEECLGLIEDPERRADAHTIAGIMERVVGEPPKMWAASMVGFGSYHYKYPSGHEGDSMLAGFAVRRTEIVIYGIGEVEGREELLAKLGKHRVGKGCLYLKRLSNVDLGVLEELVRRSVAHLRAQYPA